MTRDDQDMSPADAMTVQAKIEAVMQEFYDEERWESIFMFSSEGLLMASYGNSPEHKLENILEFNVSLINTIQHLDHHMPVNEMTVREKRGKMIVFSYFEAWREKLSLAAVISGKKGFRRALGRLVKFIQNLD